MKLNGNSKGIANQTHMFILAQPANHYIIIQIFKKNQRK